jgi:hypothetical protein
VSGRRVYINHSDCSGGRLRFGRFVQTQVAVPPANSLYLLVRDGKAGKLGVLDGGIELVLDGKAEVMHDGIYGTVWLARNLRQGTFVVEAPDRPNGPKQKLTGNFTCG